MSRLSRLKRFVSEAPGRMRYAEGERIRAKLKSREAEDELDEELLEMRKEAYRSRPGSQSTSRIVSEVLSSKKSKGRETLYSKFVEEMVSSGDASEAQRTFDKYVRKMMQRQWSKAAAEKKLLEVMARYHKGHQSSEYAEGEV